MIYLDHNATTPIDPRVLDVMMPFMGAFYGNPSSAHRMGRAVRTAIDTARSHVAEWVGVDASQITFTSGGTEANNLALYGCFQHNEQRLSFLYSATEHPSVIEPMKQLERTGCSIQSLEVDCNGIVNPEYLKQQCNDNVKLASIMHANNESGVIQPMSTIASLLKAKGVALHVDAVQSAGKIPLNFNALGADFMTLSSHKIYGPKGAGALVYQRQSAPNAMICGGGQEHGARSGTENVAGIIGFGEAARLACEELEQRSRHYLSLRQSLESQLHQLSGVSIVAVEAERLPNTTQIIVDDVDGEMLLMLMDKQSICISGGSACASRVVEPSPVLTAMGYSRQQALAAIRISFGLQNTLTEVDQFIGALKQALEQLRGELIDKA